jgi:hypothetical protein
MLLDVHRRQRQDLGPLLLPQLCRDDSADPRPDRLARFVDQHAGVVVKLDHAAVWPLPLLRRPHDHRVSHVSSPDLVRRADGDAVASLGAKVALLLHDYHDAVTCHLLATITHSSLLHSPHTDFGGPLRAQDVDALDYGSARVVDAVYEGLDCGA